MQRLKTKITDLWMRHVHRRWIAWGSLFIDAGAVGFTFEYLTDTNTSEHLELLYPKFLRERMGTENCARTARVITPHHEYTVVRFTRHDIKDITGIEVHPPGVVVRYDRHRTDQKVYDIQYRVTLHRYRKHPITYYTSFRLKNTPLPRSEELQWEIHRQHTGGMFKSLLNPVTLRTSV